jgi:hypothetical protein
VSHCHRTLFAGTAPAPYSRNTSLVEKGVKTYLARTKLYENRALRFRASCAKNHMVFGRIYLSRNTLGFPRSSMVYASTVQAEQTVPAPVTLCLLLKHTSPGLCCLGDTTFLLFRPVAGHYNHLLSIPVSQVLSTNEVASSRLFVHRHARLSSHAIQIVS